MLYGLTLPPLAAVGVQVVGIQAVRFVQVFQHLPDVHHLTQRVEPWINTLQMDTEWGSPSLSLL